nr:MAG TPA: hypothetical protein [Caudoviricetes sp.]
MGMTVLRVRVELPLPFRYRGLSYRLLQRSDRWAAPRLLFSSSNFQIIPQNVKSEYHNSHSRKRCVFILL